MKKILKIGIVMAILLSSMGCTSQKNQSINYLLCNDTSRDNMAEIESGFFFIFDETLYYADKEDMTKWVPVCNKVNCNHQETYDCNANVGGEIAQKGERLYFVSDLYVANGVVKSGPLCVREIFIDGSGSRKVYEIPFGAGVNLRSYRALISSSSLIISYSYLNEKGMYQKNISRLEDNGTLYPIYSEENQQDGGGLIFSASMYYARGMEGIVSSDLTAKYTDKIGPIEYQNILWRVDQDKPQMVSIPENVNFSYSYITEDYMIDYEYREGYEKGYYKYDFKTGIKTLLGKAEQDDARGYIMTEDCVVESNRYLEQTPENPYLKIYYNGVWKYVELPEVVTAIEDTTFIPLSIASDRIFFTQGAEGIDGYSCRLYYVMLENETLELTYCTTFGNNSYFEIPNVENVEVEFNNQWHELDMTIFDTEKFLLKVTGVGLVPKDEEKEWDIDKYKITMYCEKKNTEENLYLSLQDAAINGVYAFIPQNIWLKPGQTSAEYVIDILNEGYGKEYNFDIYSFDEYTDISFFIFDIYDKKTQRVVHVYPYGEENVIKHTRESKLTDKILIDNEYVAVTMIEHEANTFENGTVKLFIENKSDTNIQWLIDGFPKVNGIEIIQDGVITGMDKIIPSGYCSYEFLELSSELIEKNNITDIENFDISLKIWYGETWENELVNETITIPIV